MSEQKNIKVGFIGLGHMGSGMAADLLRAGHDLTVYDRDSSRSQKFAGQGARPAAQVSDVCRGDAVITMLPDDEAVEMVVFGENGVLQALGKAAVHISMSTISVALSERLASAHAGAGQFFLAAPVFGRPDMAASGKLFIIAAGEPNVFEKCAPLFEAMGQKTVHVGNDPPMANLVKLSGNFIIASIIEALSEAMALVGKAHLDRRQYLNLLTSTLFTGPLFSNYGGLISEQKYKPAGFASPLGEKDMRLTLAAAETLHVPMPLASLLHDRFMTLMARGWAELDWSALGKLAATDAGMESAQPQG